MAYVLGADFGGGSCKITLLDDQGNARASFSEEYPSYFPHPMWVEQDPDEIFRAFSDCLSRLWSEVPGAASEIKAIALDGGTHIAVLLDGEGRVIRPAIYWQDSRSTKESEEAEKAMGDALRERTFNIPSSTWTLPQLMWLQKHEGENCRRIRRILFLKDYLRHRLTGDEVTDSIDAMGSLLLDADKESWDSGFVSLAGLDESVLPDLRDPFDIAGTVTREAAASTGLKEGTPVAVGSTDTVMEMFASGAVVQGDATVKLATAGRVCIISDHAVVDKALVTYRHIIKGMWYPGTAVKTAASSLRWFRDSLSSGEFESHDHEGNVLYHDMYEYSWPAILQRLTSTVYHNYSRGGMTAKEFYESWADKNGFWQPQQAYIIALGNNDIFVKPKFRKESICG